MVRMFAKTLTKGYPIYLIEGGLEQTCELWKEQSKEGKVVIVTDSNVAGLYLERIWQSFSKAGIETSAITIEAGEKTKSLDEASILYAKLFEHRTRRRDAICALGGGVVGDLAGFLAATYMRGIRLIQVPTTLLSQVDSSIGGKVGVNIPVAKNYVGCFYQPDMVVTDPALLKSLPAEQIVEGLAEVIKYALLSSDEFLSALERNYGKYLAADLEVLEPAIRTCINYKTNVVFEDEQDYGRRAVLNLGHTVGHAIEAAGKYQKYSHGQAVGLGLLVTTRLSSEIFDLSTECYDRVKALLKKYGLPTRITDIDTGRVLKAISSDKKADDLSVNMVLLRGIGSPVINCNVDAGALKNAVDRLAESG